LIATAVSLSDHTILQVRQKQNGQLNMKSLLGKHLVKITQKQQYLWRTAMLF
jgi:hypothetical protein